jgi:hypothetical protein
MGRNVILGGAIAAVGLFLLYRVVNSLEEGKARKRKLRRPTFCDCTNNPPKYLASLKKGGKVRADVSEGASDGPTPESGTRDRRPGPRTRRPSKGTDPALTVIPPGDEPRPLIAV